MRGGGVGKKGGPGGLWAEKGPGCPVSGVSREFYKRSQAARARGGSPGRLKQVSDVRCSLLLEGVCLS